MAEQIGNEYRLKLDEFEGPMDLLLHLIRKNEVDIFDIPISLITEQYLEYLEAFKTLNVNVAGDFLVMAATLIHIKSRLLLPDTSDEDGEEDPRMEIVRPLLEYAQLKDAAGTLFERELLGRDVFVRGLPDDFKFQLRAEGEEDNLLDVNLFQLMDAFKRVLEQNIPDASISFQHEEYTVKDRIVYIIDRLKIDNKIYFHELFSDHRTLSEFIVTFLSLLELIRVGLIKAFQPGLGKDIHLKACFDEKEELDYEQIFEAGS
ncbi:MAG: segregation/condensation protein A [Deltaproteobacteria bacterium]|nr:segregation/condensation protein A [Deltaproteobacteria bacterium]